MYKEMVGGGGGREERRIKRCTLLKNKQTFGIIENSWLILMYSEVRGPRYLIPTSRCSNAFIFHVQKNKE